MVGHFGASVSAHTAPLGLSMHRQTAAKTRCSRISSRTAILSRGCRHKRRHRARCVSAAREADAREIVAAVRRHVDEQRRAGHPLALRA
eukprot:4550376-Prymnesium_polylepis.1